MNNTFFFYDLETSGFDPKLHRIMQFAGQRTDMNVQPIGEPINVLVSLSEEVLPDPQAILITGITPQKTREEGYSEAQFMQLLHDQVFLPGTIMVGFNNIRFDDEFMRYTHYRNFHDPYEWGWQDGRSRWDILDVVRLTRALRPEGIEWPVDAEGQATNRLELLSATNGLDHAKAHDALSDVTALIAVTRLIKEKQPKLFEYLLKMRGKKEVAELVNLDNPQPFVYTSGRYPKAVGHTTVAYPVAPGATPGSVIVYDLRHDPSEWANMSPADLRDLRFATFERRQVDGFVPLPAKELSYNKCPAVGPVGVLDAGAQDRLQVDLATIRKHLAKLQSSDLPEKLREAFARESFQKGSDVDAQLYDGFVNNADKPHMGAVRAASMQELADFHPNFTDERLHELLVRYKARNFPQSLNEAEQSAWEAYRAERLQRDLPKFMQQLGTLSTQAQTTHSHFLLGELQLWAESIAPVS
ncbi:MAG TPA: exodeoxyribonuclease I [Candidatus Saccharimonadales bacterium]|nr:exodeoxyribonuclease I [Candidatus Saccharimonadales bacterium]